MGREFATMGIIIKQSTSASENLQQWAVVRAENLQQWEENLQNSARIAQWEENLQQCA